MPWAAWLAAALFLALLLPRIGADTFWHHDELLTANRTREMLVRGDPFAVTLNFAPSVKKPPLQYWLCAPLLWALPGHPEFALRLPTLLSGAACLLAAAWLAGGCPPGEDGSLAAWTAAALAGCGYLIHFSRAALLDSGAALLLTLAVAGCRMARRDARWWWFVALQCVLGAWQKAPYGLAAWALLLLAGRFLGASRAEADAPPAHRWPHHLPAAFAVALLGSLAWWCIEWMRADHALLLAAGSEQVGMFLRAHDPKDPGLRPWLYWGWLARGWGLPGVCAPLAAAATLLAGRRERPRAELGLLCVIYGGTIACFVYRNERYLVIITPLLAVVSVDWLRRVSARLPTAAHRWLLPVALASTLPTATHHYFSPSPSRPDLVVVSRELGRTLHSDERILVCTDAESGFDADLFVLFYADLRRPLEAVKLPFVEALPDDAGRCRGICARAQWERLRQLRPAWQAVMTRGNWVLWTN